MDKKLILTGMCMLFMVMMSGSVLGWYSPAVYYPEGDGVDVINGNNLTLNGASSTTGLLATAIQCVAAESDHPFVNGLDNLLNGTGWTVDFWIKGSADNDEGILYVSDDLETSDYLRVLGQVDNYYWQQAGGSTAIEDTPDSLCPDGSWCNFIWTYNGSHTVLYFNGTQNGIQSGGNVLTADHNSLNLCSDRAGTAQFSDSIFENLAIFNVGYSAQNASDAFNLNGGTPLNYSVVESSSPAGTIQPYLISPSNNTYSSSYFQNFTFNYSSAGECIITEEYILFDDAQDDDIATYWEVLPGLSVYIFGFNTDHYVGQSGSNGVDSIVQKTALGNITGFKANISIDAGTDGRDFLMLGEGKSVREMFNNGYSVQGTTASLVLRRFPSAVTLDSVTNIWDNDGYHIYEFYKEDGNITLKIDDVIIMNEQDDYYNITSSTFIGFGSRYGSGIDHFIPSVKDIYYKYDGYTPCEAGSAVTADFCGLYTNENGSFALEESITEYSHEEYCYQESANVSTVCGGLNTGTYYFGGTYTDFPTQTIFVNYSIPDNTISAIAQHQDEDSTYNVTIPSICLEQDKLNLWYYLTGDMTFYSRVYCYNGTDYQKLYEKNNGGAGIYNNQSMWWGLRELSIPINTTIGINHTFTSDGTYLWNIGCNSSGVNLTFATENYTITLDTNAPDAPTTNFVNGIRVAGTNLTGQFNLSDNIGLYSYNITIDGVQIDGATGLNVPTYIYNLSYNIDNLSLGEHILGVRQADGHTAEVLLNAKDYNPDKGLILHNSLEYKFNGEYDKTNIKMYLSDSSLSDKWDYIERIDRYSEILEPSKPSSTQTIIVESENTINLYEDPEGRYGGKWLVIGEHWKDFVLVGEPDAKIDEIVFVTSNKVAVTISGIKNNPEKLTFESTGDLNVLETNYTFVHDALVNFTSNNIYNSSVFSNFTIQITNSTGGKTTYSTGTNTSQSVQLGNGTYSFFLNSSSYMSKRYPTSGSVVVNSSYYNITYNTSQAISNFRVQVLQIGDFLSNFTINITNVDTLQNDSSANTDGVETFYVNAGTYNYTFTKPGYAEQTGQVNITFLENKTEIIIVPINVVAHIYDESTLDYLNLSNFDQLQFFAFCANQTTVQDIVNTTSANLSITCAYEKVKFVATQGTTVYYRTILFGTGITNVSGDATYELDTYLIDTTTTNYLYNTISLDDIYSTYLDTSIYIWKNIPSGRVLIHSDYTDIEGKIGAYLMSNNEYEVEVRSSNNPTTLIGTYSADISGAKSIKLYTVTVAPTGGSNFFSTTSYTSGVTNGSIAYLNYVDTSSNTDLVTWSLRQNTPTGTTLYSTSSTSASGVNIQSDIADYMNTSERIYAVTQFVQGGKAYQYSVPIWHMNLSLSEVPNALTGSMGLGPNWFPIFLTVLLGIIALSATSINQNFVGIGIVVLLLALGGFGWYALAFKGLIALIAVIILINLWSEGRQRIG